MMLWSFGHVRETMLHSGMRTSSTFNAQHVATLLRNRVAKRTQHVALNNVATRLLKCCDRLAVAYKYWANNVAICRADML